MEDTKMEVKDLKVSYIYYSNGNDFKKKKTFSNNELEIKLTPYIDDKQNIWVKGKEIAQILGH